MDLNKLQFSPTEVPAAHFLPLDFPISFTDRITRVVEMFEVTDSAYEISSSEPFAPIAQFRARSVDHPLREFYGFTTITTKPGPDGFLGQAWLVGTKPLDSILCEGSLVTYREDMQEVLEHIVHLRSQLKQLGFNDHLMCQRLWPAVETDTWFHLEDKHQAKLLINALTATGLETDGEFVVEPDEVGDGAVVSIQNFSYTFTTPPGIFTLTTQMSVSGMANLLRKYKTV